MNISFEDTERFLKEIGIGIRPINDPFFKKSYEICKVFQKTGVTVEDDESLCHEMMKEFVCNAPGCNKSFQNLLDYEIHYNSIHRFTCLECKKIKPNARLLEIHIQETHDSFFSTLAEKKPMYQCYVSDCELKFMTAIQRKNHCIKDHKFPKNFKCEESHRQKGKNKDSSNDSMEIDRDIKNINTPTTNLYKNQRIKTFNPRLKNKNNPPVNEKAPSSSIQSSTSSKVTSSLVFIPRQLMQKSYSKVLTQDKKMNTDILENNSMMDLAEALPH